MEMMIFFESDPVTLCDQVNTWLDQFGDNRPIKIHHIKQTALPPDTLIMNTIPMNHDDVIEREAYLVLSIWYDEIKKNGNSKK